MTKRISGRPYNRTFFQRFFVIFFTVLLTGGSSRRDGSFAYFPRSQARKPGFFGSAEGSGSAVSASTVPVLSGICSSVPERTAEFP